MSVTAVPLQPLSKGTIAKFWIGLLIVVLLAVGLAWLGTSGMQFQAAEKGVRYRALESGSGEPLTPNDLAQIHIELRDPKGAVLESTEQIVDPQSGQIGRTLPINTESLPPYLQPLASELREGGSYQLFGPASELLGPRLPPNIQATDEIQFRLFVVSVERNGVERERERQRQQQMMQQQMMQQMMEQQQRGGGAPGTPPPGMAPPGGPGGF